MELDDEAENTDDMLVVVPVTTDSDEYDEQSASKRAKTTHQRDEELELIKEHYDLIKSEVDTVLRKFAQKRLTKHSEVLSKIEQQVRQNESQLREKYYFVPHCYAAQLNSRPSTHLTMSQLSVTPIYMAPHPSTPKTTAHVTIRRNVAPRGFEEYSRPRHFSPYFEDGEAEADEETIRKYYYAPPRYFNDVATELQLFRLLMHLEQENDSDELIGPRSIELASRVSRVPAAVIKYYFTEHLAYLKWKIGPTGSEQEEETTNTEHVTAHSSVMSHDEFWEWYCRQCKIFMCARHDNTTKWRPVHCARRTSDLSAVSGSKECCSDTCHLKIPQKEFTDTLSVIQAELLRNGLIIFAKNYCRIRKYHARSLTCAEVRDYCATHLSAVKALPKLAAPQTRAWKIISRKKTHDKELAAYQPCSHEGPCHKSAQCYCYAHNLYCEKYCACVESCGHRFKGCKCKNKTSASGAVKACDKNCSCAQNSRECDPDACQCDPKTCGQRDLQTKKPKHLWIGASAVAGFGLFSVNRIQSGEFIGEYVGEVIPANEAERRGLIADKIKRSYLFDTGSDLCVDSTKFGNRLKFANHSSKPNVQPKQLRVNGELRLAFYAVEDIEPNEELFINYDYSDPSSKGIVNERPVDVLANKGHVDLLEIQSPGDIGELVHESDSSVTSEEEESVEEL